jgi:hypothetical protein
VIYQEILENDSPLPTVKRSSASSAIELHVRQNLARCDTRELVMRAAVRAPEWCCVGGRHGVVRFGARSIYFSEPRSPNRSRTASRQSAWVPRKNRASAERPSGEESFPSKDFKKLPKASASARLTAAVFGSGSFGSHLGKPWVSFETLGP